MPNTSKFQIDTLKSVPETLLIPLWARSVEAKQPQPILRDPKAIALVESIDFDFQRIAGTALRPVEICMRAAVIDGFVRRFLERNPTGTIVEIGPGLDTRYERLDNGQATWWEIDLPETMEIRRRVFCETERRRFLANSVLETQWLDHVSRDDPAKCLFVAEGVFYYFSQEDVVALWTRLADRLPGCSMVFDSQSPFLLRRTSKGTNRAAGLERLRWTVRRTRDIESWSPRFRVLENAGFGDSPYYDGMMSRMQWYIRLARRVFPPLREVFRVTRVRLGRT